MPTKRSGKVEKKTTKRVARKTPKFTLEVRVNDLVYKGSAPDLRTAWANFLVSPDYPFPVKTKAIIRFSNGKVSRQLIWPTVRSRRMFKIFSIKPDRAELLADQMLNMLINETKDRWLKE